ncbi:MAG: phosphoribosylanthranilate isomerase [Candidatus Dormibacteraceae bacterium]
MRGPRTLVKVCGVRDAVSAVAAVEAGADLIGFQFCLSRRRLTPEEAIAIVRELPRRPALVGVFIDEDPRRAEEIAGAVGLDLLQLNGSEPAGYPVTRPVMKVLKVGDGDIPGGSGWPDPIMLDSWSVDQRGGTGRTWDWGRASDLIRRRRVFVAGGLHPANVGALVREHRPHGVDVSSGVESEPGRKDPELVRAFVEAVRRADDERA